MRLVVLFPLDSSETMATQTASDLSGQNLELARPEILDVAIVAFFQP